MKWLKRLFHRHDWRYEEKEYKEPDGWSLYITISGIVALGDGKYRFIQLPLDERCKNRVVVARMKCAECGRARPETTKEQLAKLLEIAQRRIAAGEKLKFSHPFSGNGAFYFWDDIDVIKRFTSGYLASSSVDEKVFAEALGLDIDELHQMPFEKSRNWFVGKELEGAESNA